MLFFLYCRLVRAMTIIYIVCKHYNIKKKKKKKEMNIYFVFYVADWSGLGRGKVNRESHTDTGGLFIAPVYDQRKRKTLYININTLLHIHKMNHCMKKPVTAQLISTFVFASWIVQFPFFLNRKFQAYYYFP